MWKTSLHASCTTAYDELIHSRRNFGIVAGGDSVTVDKDSLLHTEAAVNIVEAVDAQK